MSDNTVNSYAKDMRSFLCAVGTRNELLADEFDYAARLWLNQSRKRGLAAKTIGRHICSLKAFAKWGSIEHQLNDYRAPTPLKSDPHPLVEGIPAIDKMIEVADDQEHKALIALCGLCGLRVAEALSVQASHIDANRRVLKVTGKGDKDRKVPISTKAWAVLETSYIMSFLSDDTPFVNLGNRSARRIVTILGQRAGVSRRVASHDLRATFATAVYNSTKQTRIVQELLGHASISTTEGYLGMTQKQLADAVEL